MVPENKSANSSIDVESQNSVVKKKADLSKLEKSPSKSFKPDKLDKSIIPELEKLPKTSAGKKNNDVEGKIQ